jgi:hypothetical protein
VASFRMAAARISSSSTRLRSLVVQRPLLQREALAAMELVFVCPVPVLNTLELRLIDRVALEHVLERRLEP